LNTPRSIQTLVVVLVIGVLCGAGVVALAVSGDDSQDTIAETVTVTTTQTVPTSEPKECRATAQLRSRHVLSHVSGTVTLAPSRRLIVVSITAKVRRSFAVYLYNSRTNSRAILTAAGGTASTRALRSARALARYDRVVIAAVVNRPRRGRHRAHRVVRVLASASIGRLLNGLARCNSASPR
jgi:hypothetical protein